MSNQKLQKKDAILAWHFINGNKLRNGKVAPADGKVLQHPANEPLELCASGLHASENILHALSYAPGLILCRVRCYGEIACGEDKLVCRKRVIVWRLEEEVMHRVLIWWAFWCTGRAQEIAAEAAEKAAAEAAQAAREAWAAWEAEQDIQATELKRLITLARG